MCNQNSNGRIVNFFHKYEKVISGSAAILAIIGIFLIFYQVREAKIQIRANTSYQIHKDGREIFKTIDHKTVDYITQKDPQKTYDQELIRKAESKINEILMYYASLYKQYEFGNIDENSWLDISKEICNFLKFSNVTKFWRERIEISEMWNPEFIQFGKKCIQKGARHDSKK